MRTAAAGYKEKTLTHTRAAQKLQRKQEGEETISKKQRVFLMYSQIVPTKLIPALRRRNQTVVLNQKLSMLCKKLPERPLTLLCAASGYGKTTVMGEWYRQMADQSVRVCWITPDMEEREAGEFLHYILESLRQGGVVQGTEAYESLLNLQHHRSEKVLAAIINELLADQRPVILFIDNYQHVENDDIQRIIERLTQNAPPHFHLVIATQSRPLFSVANLKAQNHLTELTYRDLRFDLPEVQQFVAHLHQIETNTEQARTILRHTEGWPSGLCLAIMAMDEGATEIAEFDSLAAGNTRDLKDYIENNVLLRHSQAVQNFLLQTSVLRRFNWEVCDHLLGINNSQEMLNTLCDECLFIEPLDTENGWYRYHHQFKSVLQTRLLQTTSLSHIRQLNKSISHWFANKGMLSEALGYASEAQDYPYLSKLIEHGSAHHLRFGQMSAVLDWISRLPESSLSLNTQLSVLKCWALIHLQQPADAVSALTSLELSLSRIQAGKTREDLLQKVQVLRAGVALSTDDIDNACKLAEVATKQLATRKESAIGLVGGAWNIFGFCLYRTGQFDRARTALHTARTSHNSVGSVFGIMYSDCFLGLLESALGHLHLAENYLVKAEDIARSNAVRGSTMAAEPSLYRGCLNYQMNRLDSAQQLIEQAAPMVEEKATPGAPIEGMVTLARIAAALNDKEQTFSILNQARRFCSTRERYLWGTLVEKEWLYHSLGDGNLYQAAASLSAVGMDWIEDPAAMQDTSDFQQYSWKMLMKIRMLIALEKTEQAKQWLDYLEPLSINARRASLTIEHYLLRATVNLAENNTNAAHQSLAKALELGADGFVRIYLDEGESIIQLLRDYQALMPISRLAAQYAQTLCKQAGLSATEESKPLPSQAIVESLGERELSLIKLIAEGKTNDQMSEALFISKNTVKWHLKNIYGKLGVRNRTSALYAAKKIQLIQ